MRMLKSQKQMQGPILPIRIVKADSVNSGSYYVVYICEMDKSTSSKSILAKTTVTLDASNSEPCEDDSEPCDDYIAEYNWDLDLLRDEDGDGDPENDADLTGETVDWKEVVTRRIQNFSNSHQMVKASPVAMM